MSRSAVPLQTPDSRFKLRSMRARMTTTFAIFAALLMGTGSMAFWKSESLRLEGVIREALGVARERARFEMKEREMSQHTVLAVTREAQGEISVGGLALLVLNDKGKVIWKSRRQTPNWPEIGPYWRVSSLTSGGQTLVMARDWRPMAEELRQIALRLALLSIVVVVATATAAWGIVGKTLSPIEKLATQAQNASTESLQVQLNSPSSDAEMYRLTETLNGLLARLEKEAHARGRFYAAASHELRTPIQGLLGRLDVAGSRSRSVPEYEELIKGLQRSTEKLATLVQDLLELNALEMRQNQVPCERLNLVFWVERAIEQQAKAIEARQLQVEAQLNDAFIEAAPHHVEILLHNLVENAVKYATPGTKVRIRLNSTPGRASLQIENDSDVPEQTDVRDWFEPFYRMDRVRTSQTSGNGLGLSIVAAIARANGWNVELQTREGGVLACVAMPVKTRKPN